MSNDRPKPTRDQGKSAPGQASTSSTRTLTKSRKNAVLGGVCGGLAQLKTLPAGLWRLLFLSPLLASLFGYVAVKSLLLITVPLLLLGAALYLALWIFLPGDPSPGPGVTPLFRKADWVSFGVTTLLVFIGYYYTLAPDLTLEDSGELAVGSYYAGVPHPPGYPVWTIYTWLFTVLVPVSNVAWRVALSSAVAGALACGLIALVTSRVSSMIIEGMEAFRGIEQKWENAVCVVAGYVAGMLLGFNGFMWSQAVIVEVYTLSVLSLMGVLGCLLRWVYAPEQRRYLYWAFFLFGVCFTNHQTLIVAAMGIEVAVLAARPKLGRDLFAFNSLVYLVGLLAKAAGVLTAFENLTLFQIYNLVGLGSLYAVFWFSIKAKPATKWITLLAHLSVNVLIWLIWLASRKDASAVELAKLDKNVTMLLIFFNPGLITLLYLYHLLVGTAERILTEWATAVVLGLFGALGAAFYFYMPLASMTNPPLNWGYPRTWEGFIHAFTRGQYERTNPTSDLGRLMDQFRMYFEGAVEEFTLVYLVIALIPLAYLFFRQAQSAERKGWLWITGLYAFFCLGVLMTTLRNPAFVAEWPTFRSLGVGMACGYVFLLLAALPFHFFRLMDRPERAWIAGLTVTYVCLAVLLIVLLNFSADKQSREMSRVFFTASHVMIAIGVGCGLTIIGGLMTTHYDRFRRWGLGGATLACSAAVYVATVIWSNPASAVDQTPLFDLEPSRDPLERWTALLSVGLAVAGIVLFGVFRTRAPMALLLGLFALLPAKSILSHWADNEQRGHLFGYWFGHDMFTPPFNGPDGKPIYPEMARDAILFGGTDPGRFAPTYMIFCESFIPPEKKKDTDPKFDRRDVYIITQNALADGTYLSYIRAHYNRSAQIDSPFFQDMLRSREEQMRGTTNIAARVAYKLLDVPFTKLGARIEARRRDEGVYPPTEILTPTPEDHARSMNDYMLDAERRMRLNQLKPGEDVRVDRESGRLSVSGQVSVMAINGLLTKVIFDKNPTNEFYVEESFPLDWMFDYLEPYGIIMRINRHPLPEITEEMARKDHDFWSQYSDRLIGNWITYDTPVKEICDFIERVYLRRNFDGFKGDRRFIRDKQAQKSFSKLRSSIGGVYSWRYSRALPGPAKDRMLKEADFAFRQAFAYCPYSPEAVFRYTTLLASVGRLEDAELITETCLKFDRENVNVQNWVDQIKTYRRQQGAMDRLQQMEREFRTNPANARLGFELASIYVQSGQTNAALFTLDQLVNNPQSDANTLVSVANAYVQLQQGGRLETALRRLVQISPENAEGWYDLASSQVLLGKTDDALQVLTRALQLSDQRLRADPKQRNLRADAATNRNFDSIRSHPEFRKLLAPP